MGLRLDRVLLPEGKEKAVTFSFDDAVVEDVRMIALLNKYQLKATFNVNTGCFGEKDRMPIEDRELYHEVIAEKVALAVPAQNHVGCGNRKHIWLQFYSMKFIFTNLTIQIVRHLKNYLQMKNIFQLIE